MTSKLIFNFEENIPEVKIPLVLNNPFTSSVSEIARLAVNQFQDFITLEAAKWEYNFRKQKGKMFGILVIQKEDNSYGFLGAISGKIPNNATQNRFVPSVFDDSTGDFFINKGMSKLSEIRTLISISKDLIERELLKKKSKIKSIELQKRLFENYIFMNRLGKEQNVLEIFKNSNYGYPPSAAGECSAPKLLQHAFKHKLKPIAIAEFWWGNTSTNRERKHKIYYPACKNKCRPILEFMLDDSSLFNEASN